MRCGGRTIARLAVLLLTLYVVVDFATPLLPGAFRFEMSQSIEAGGRPGIRPAASVAQEALAPDRVPAIGRLSVSMPARVRRPDVTAPQVRDVPRPTRADSPPDSPEDH